MTRERAIEVLDRWTGFGSPDEEYARVGFEANINDVEEAHDMAIAALREQEVASGAIRQPMTNANDEPSQIEKLAARYERNMHKPWKKTKTNADRIRAMSDEELAEFMCDNDNSWVTSMGRQLRYDNYLEWLKQPVEEDA